MKNQKTKYLTNLAFLSAVVLVMAFTPLGTKRKRTRITKKETDKVYSVKGATGENFDLKKSKTTPATSQLPLFEEPVADSKDAKSAETEVVCVICFLRY